MRQERAGEVRSDDGAGLPGAGRLSAPGRGARILSLYDAILEASFKMREYASRLDMAAFQREADAREGLIRDLAAAWADAPADEEPGLVAAARVATGRILDVDAETARAIGKSRDDLISGMKQLRLERECMSSYRASAGHAGEGPRFVDRMK